MLNQGAVLSAIKAPLTLEQRSVPKPAQDEVLVKNKALATNPVDYKMQETGNWIDRYPVVLGSDIAGIIEGVGSEVTHFNKGDRVCGFADVLLSKNPEHGAFQQYTILKEWAGAKLPDHISFEGGAVLPMSIATAATGMFLAMDLPRPPTKQQGGFLVWGASSSVGTAVVQIAAAMGYTVYAVCSPRHFDYIKQLGAYVTFDYNEPSVVKTILQSLKASSEQIVLGYDAISEHGSAPQCAEIIRAFGGGKLCLTIPYSEDAKKPDGVEIVSTYAARIVTEKEFGAWLFNEWLEKSLADKTYVPSPAVEIVEGGIGAVQKALDLHKQGLSGKKLVLPV